MLPTSFDRSQAFCDITDKAYVIASVSPALVTIVQWHRPRCLDPLIGCEVIYYYGCTANERTLTIAYSRFLTHARDRQIPTPRVFRQVRQ